MSSFNTILHPTDFSQCARSAFDLAGSLAKSHGARLVAAHVVDAEYGIHTFGGIPVEVRPSDYPERARQMLKTLEPPDPSVRIEHIVTEGRPVEEILRLAKETQSDLIVIGTYGLTGIKRLLLGSVAEQVVRQSECPVLTTKGSGEERVPVDVPIPPAVSPP